MKKKNAFTLAEVLITLGIIGIVAAITLPLLVQNYQKMVLKNQFKNAYSIAQNAYKMAEAKLGFAPQCYYSYDWIGAPCIKYENGLCVEYGEAVNPTNQSSDCSVLREQLMKTYKVVKVCEKNAFSDGCIPAYKGLDTVYMDKNPDAGESDINSSLNGCSGFSETNIRNKTRVWNLADGIIIIWYSDRLFALDVNGMKSPNKWGYDIFSFMVYKHKSGALKLQPGRCMPIEKGGVSTAQMLKDLYK